MEQDMLMIPKCNMNEEDIRALELLEYVLIWEKQRGKKEKRHMDDEHMEVIGKALPSIERTNSL